MLTSPLQHLDSFVKQKPYSIDFLKSTRDNLDPVNDWLTLVVHMFNSLSIGLMLPVLISKLCKHVTESDMYKRTFLIGSPLRS